MSALELRTSSLESLTLSNSEFQTLDVIASAHWGTPSRDHLNIGQLAEGMSEPPTSIGTQQTAEESWSAAAPKGYRVLDEQGT
ncbi:hypothetical protein DXG01_012092, partial [Tephrocybe rancida]